jgi:hypothetical protein
MTSSGVAVTFASVTLCNLMQAYNDTLLQAHEALMQRADRTACL